MQTHTYAAPRLQDCGNTIAVTLGFPGNGMETNGLKTVPA